MFASDCSHCHPPDSVLGTNILLSHAIYPSLCSSNKEDRERDRVSVCIDYIITCAGCHAPELIAATKFKTTEINFGGLFGVSTKTKITCSTVLAIKTTVLCKVDNMYAWSIIDQMIPPLHEALLEDCCCGGIVKTGTIWITLLAGASSMIIRPIGGEFYARYIWWSICIGYTPRCRWLWDLSYRGPAGHEV